jgi:integrase/recombinase XerD
MLCLTAATKDFLNHCKFEKHLSKKTIKAYETDLRQLFEFICAKNYSTVLTDVTKRELREYVASIVLLKPKSIKRKVASVKAMFNYLEFEDHLAINPFRKIRIRIKEGNALPRTMDLKEITRMFSLAYKTKEKKRVMSSYARFEALRNVVILELLFSTGGRVSEIANLEIAKINLDTGSIRFKGKGDKERVIQVCNPETLTILKTYYKTYKEKIENSGGFFLINRFNKKLSDQSIRGIIRTLAINAGVSKHVTPHMFRHSFATLLLEKDVDIKYIQTLLGHSSIMTTQIYTHVNREKQKRILSAKHPRKDFTMISAVNTG